MPGIRPNDRQLNSVARYMLLAVVVIAIMASVVIFVQFTPSGADAQAFAADRADAMWSAMPAPRLFFMSTALMIVLTLILCVFAHRTNKK